jgi:hypothetical protein
LRWRASAELAAITALAANMTTINLEPMLRMPNT